MKNLREQYESCEGAWCVVVWFFTPLISTSGSGLGIILWAGSSLHFAMLIQQRMKHSCFTLVASHRIVKCVVGCADGSEDEEKPGLRPSVDAATSE